MRSRLLLRGLALAAALSAGGEATACFYTTPIPIMVDGRPPSQRQIAANQRLGRLFAAQRALAGGTDASAELAKMLVPNIRPVMLLHSDCGPMNENDLADGEETVEDWLAGTYLAGGGADRFAAVVRGRHDETFGPACNAEFRERFSAHLRRRLDARQLRASYLFLATRWRGEPAVSRAPRLIAFEGRTRRPPLRWVAANQWDDAQIARWLARKPAGRALKQAMDEFWAEATPLLDDSASACPAAVAAWPAVQARIVAEIEERYPAAARRMREAQPR
jgi:hypothetical protein